MKTGDGTYMNGKNIVKNIAIGFALALAGAGAVLFYKNNIAMNPGETLLKYMSYAEDGEYGLGLYTGNRWY